MREGPRESLWFARVFNVDSGITERLVLLLIALQIKLSYWLSLSLVLGNWLILMVGVEIMGERLVGYRDNYRHCVNDGMVS